MPSVNGNAVATHAITIHEGSGRGWTVYLEMPRGRLADATRLLRGGLATPSRNGLPGRLRIAAKLAASGQNPAAYLREGEVIAGVAPVAEAGQ